MTGPGWGGSYPPDPPKGGQWNPSYPGANNPPGNVPWEGHGSIAAPFSGSGQLAFSGISQNFAVPLVLTSDGQLSIDVTPQHTVGLNLGSDGKLFFTLEGQQAVDFPLGSDGQLSFGILQQINQALNLGGDGQLSLATIQRLNPALNFGSDGALSFLAQKRLTQALNLSGDGQLSIPVLYRPTPQPLTLSGSGQLAITTSLISPQWLATGAGKGSNVSPITFSDTAPAGTMCTLIWVNNASTALNPTISAQYGSVAATLLKTTLADTVTNSLYLTCYGILWTPSNPLPSGAQTVSFSTTTPAACGVNVVHYGNVSAIGTPIFLSNQAVAACSIGAPSSLAKYLYVNGFTYTGAAAGNTFTGYLPNTPRWNPPLVVGANNPIVVGDAFGNAGTLTFSANRSNTVNAWGGMIVPLMNS